MKKIDSDFLEKFTIDADEVDYLSLHKDGDYMVVNLDTMFGCCGVVIAHNLEYTCDDNRPEFFRAMSLCLQSRKYVGRYATVLVADVAGQGFAEMAEDNDGWIAGERRTNPKSGNAVVVYEAAVTD
jgi:hypothetical protein